MECSNRIPHAVALIDISPHYPQQQFDVLVDVATWLNRRLGDEIMFETMPTARKIINGWTYPRIVDETTNTLVVVDLEYARIHTPRCLDASFKVRLAQGEYRICFKDIAEHLGHIERFHTTMGVGVIDGAHT